MKKRLYLSRDDKKLAGVCGGVADYIDLDATIVRLLWVLFTIMSSGAGLILYIIAAIIMTEAPKTFGKAKVVDVEVEIVRDDNSNDKKEQVRGESTAENHKEKKNEMRDIGKTAENNHESILFGGILVILGSYLFTRNFFNWYWLNYRFIVPVVIIGIGVGILFKGRK